QLQAVFITGCDSGFGYGLTRRLDKLGYRVFAGCLFPEGEGASKLKAESSSEVTIVPLDVTSDDSVVAAFETISDSLKNR
ncbi:D-beta-hydroxybutyrate dehydrogenase, partial [Tropilaelaps mercedesae]